jgi:rhamnose transport system substrate-binding protein
MRKSIFITLLVLLSISIASVVAFGEGAATSATPITIYMVPKFTGAPYFSACEQGALQAVSELNELGLPVKFYYMGPSTANTEDEIKTITSIIALHPNALLYSSNNYLALIPVLKQAMAAGIKVVGFDADVADPSARDLFINQVDFNVLARTLIDLVAQNVGPDAGIAILSADPNAANQNAWIAAIKAYMAQSYPKMNIVTIQYGGDLPGPSYQDAQTIINAYYPKAKAIVAITSVAFPMAAQAVLDAGLAGKIYVVGLATPNDMKKYFQAGVVKQDVLWNPVHLGYLALYAANDLVRGMMMNNINGTEYIGGGKLGFYAVGPNNVVLLGKPFIFTAQNVNQFNF